ncbi:molybdenum cofactor biosynthesis protein MoaE [Litorihabitans aurantiacus]|uniref:molybdenum cofactor biosynthesis protein MoaE n=1 Tax=Litorihabitans aurantiacus TaxID=1930061 RepID=UPI0024E09634|nr:molybdenum cofactor biosynthesis protein MoaE [Litorihabitans aurantiacus]
MTSDVLDLAAHEAAVQDAGSGAVVTFVGRIRDHDPGAHGEVTGIDYSHHPDAERILGEIAARAAAAGPEGVRIAVSHRVGTLAVGDLALVACVATAHRGDAYDVSRALVEAVKAELPIWKRQHEVGGRTHWVGL